MKQFDNAILNDFYDYLREMGKLKSTSEDYCRRIEKICDEQGVTPERLAKDPAMIRALIDDYLVGGSKHAENAKKHYAPSSALQHFDAFVGQGGGNGATPNDDARRNTERKDVGDDFGKARIYLHQTVGYQSFERVDKHWCEIEIRNRDCTIKFKENGQVCDTVKKTINDKNYTDLIKFMRAFGDVLNEDETPAHVAFPFGGVSSYEYDFEGKANYSGAAKLFDSDDRSVVEKAYDFYREIIERIVAQ